MEMENLTIEEIRKRLEKLERFRQKHNKQCLDYYYENHERMANYRRLKAKEYYDKNKNDPVFKEKKRLNGEKQNQKKKIETKIE